MKNLYIINYPEEEKDICGMELKYLLNEIPDKKYLFSELNMDISRSPFIKECIRIHYCKENLLELVNKIIEDKLEYHNFKVAYIKLEDKETTYEERLDALKAVGMVIKGTPNIKNPDKILGITKVNGVWYFGEYEKNNYRWHKHWKVPNTYSNALPARMARALINIAVGNNLELKVIDPCCGIGTVVIEGLSMGMDIVGVELNSNIAINAKENIKFLNYKDVIINKDMMDIGEIYDVAIVDLPYGLFTKTTIEDQIGIIRATRNIANKAIIISFEDMDKIIIDSGFNILDKCVVPKNKVKRIISICK